MVTPYVLVTNYTHEYVIGEYAEQLRLGDRLAAELLRRIQQAYCDSTVWRDAALLHRKNPKGEIRPYPSNDAGRRLLYAGTKSWRVWKKHFARHGRRNWRETVAAARAAGCVKDEEWFRNAH